MAALSNDRTNVILSRMVFLPEKPPSRGNIVLQLFDRVIIRGGENPLIQYLWSPKRIVRPFHNDSSHRVRLLFCGHRSPVEIPPETTSNVELDPIDLAYPPIAEYVAASFFQTVFSVRELQEGPEETFTLKLDFSKFTFVEFELCEDEFQLKIGNERENDEIVTPKEFKFAKQKDVDLQAFEEEKYILAKFKNGTSELYGSFLKKDPHMIEEIVFKVWDHDNRIKTVVLKSP